MEIQRLLWSLQQETLQEAYEELQYIYWICNKKNMVPYVYNCNFLQFSPIKVSRNQQKARIPALHLWFYKDV